MAVETVTLLLDEGLVADAMQYTDELSDFVNRALEALLRNDALADQWRDDYNAVDRRSRD
jgi:hypothetical protein